MTAARQLAAILAVDVAGFSRLIGEENARIVVGAAESDGIRAVTASPLSV